jgi:hypothetical protein
MSEHESTGFCCGACEHVALASEHGTGYTPSPPMFVEDAGPSPALVSRYGACRIELTRGMRVTIGRAHACDVRIDDPALSARTCELRVTEDGDVYIADLESACGTVVNASRISAPHRLHEHDSIRIGNTLLISAHRPPVTARPVVRPVAGKANPIPRAIARLRRSLR